MRGQGHEIASLRATLDAANQRVGRESATACEMEGERDRLRERVGRLETKIAHETQIRKLAQQVACERQDEIERLERDNADCHADLGEALGEVERLEAEAQRYRDELGLPWLLIWLRNMEWRGPDIRNCPDCGEDQEDGHAEGCGFTDLIPRLEAFLAVQPPAGA